MLTTKNNDMGANEMIAFWSKLEKGIVYFYDDYYDNAFKIDMPNKKAFAKYKGKQEFEIAIESEKFELSIIPGNEITEKKYIDF